MSGSKHTEHGAFCWHQLQTSSEAGAREFYTGLFGWETEHHDMGDRGNYVILKHEGREIGGPFEVPTVGHIAVCTDPQGAAFSMVQFA